MANSFYENSKAILHAYSHSPYIEGQQFTDQAGARAGHYINQYEVRAEEIPAIKDIEERDKFIVNNGTRRIVGGTRGAQYQNIIRFIDKFRLEKIANSNGEAWYVVDEANNDVPLKNFICPTDAQISFTQPSFGYEIQLFSQDGKKQIPFNYGWRFDTFNGILHFSPTFKPGMTEWIQAGFGNYPTLEGFVYIGKYATDVIQNVNETVENVSGYAKEVDDQSIAIQPCIFSTAQMTPIGDPYIKEYSGILKTVPEYCRKMSFIVPGYCFEISTIDNTGKNETFITEMSHIPYDETDPNSGDTIIYIDIPWNIENDCPNYKSSTGENQLGDYVFKTASFIKNNGGNINVKETINRLSGDVEINETLGSYDRQWTPPPRAFQRT